MPLPTPILDDRSWQQLRDELVRRIPVYTPEWTDHNPSDPGITLLELFAFLGENLLFRFNQVPEATRLEFLRLLQIPLRPAQPSRAMVELTPTGGEVLVPAGTEARAGSLSFETQDESMAWPLTARAFAKVTSAEPTGDDARIYTDAALAARGLASDETAAYYTSTLLDPDPSVPGFTPVDFGATVDGIVWIAVLRPKTVDDLTAKRNLGGRVMNLGFIPDPEVVGIDEVDPCPGAGAQASTDDVVWEVSTPVLKGDDPVYRPLVVSGDTTRGLTRQGVVRLKLPDDVTTFGVGAPPDPDAEGTGAFPPVVDDPDIAATVVFWVRGYRRAGDRRLGRVLWIGANAAEVLQVRTAQAELLGTGTARPAQTYALVHTPVIDRSAVVEVDEPGGWTPWTQVDDFAAAGRDDRVYTVDLEAGTVRFGDGTRGRVPQIGERVRARVYRYGGGRAGNVAAKAISRVTGVGGVRAANPRPAYGGADAEAVKDAVERIPGELRRHDRAVTAADFRELALATPGADVGRAEVMPRFHPPTRQQEAAGIVTVVVWPYDDALHPNAPLPDRDLLACVCAWLDARRLVTTELYVIPPTYRKVAVSVGVSVKPGFGVEAVRAWVELVLRQYLAPLPPFGPSGDGWPLGRRVYGPELEAAVLQVEGVEYVAGLALKGAAAAADGTLAWSDGPVVLQAWEVPELTSVSVISVPDGAPVELPDPVEGISPAPPAGVAVPIPTLKEEC